MVYPTRFFYVCINVWGSDHKLTKTKRFYFFYFAFFNHYLF